MNTSLLAELTTTGVGGAANSLVRATTDEQIITTIRAADATGTPLLLVAGGSNLLIDDSGFPGTVLQIATTGVHIGKTLSDGRVRVEIAAGHPWDDVVAQSLAAGLSGLEALSGIPGSAGATPVQNVGAYGSEVAHTFLEATVFDRSTGTVSNFGTAALGFGYRDSLLKRTTTNGSPEFVVLSVSFALEASSQSAPIRYAELARSLGVGVGERADARAVRETVLALRASKGMVFDPTDRDSCSTGSFFTNPIVPASALASLPADAPNFPVDTPGMVKLSAAWLIDRAGFAKGFGLTGTAGEKLSGGRASLSTKHTLAITNRGQASSADILAIARAVRAGVKDRFGIELHNEPLLIGCEL
ncbi:UDP-N-acetylmuramate dehydrogenase [Paeniglutamicibacter terrestris]|uniref:UDP-N-acetylenolpyruvoylglucosamine reductase n=1 Tax=Paeniglutamicibacter terrestris TaxID=2723403 RepID=A0ABX1G3I7_9MICC|nr:UDP-N-acetylenolpyruvoylglucosamine reductase [Arthrobacter sp. 7749]NKG20235.1 UDP-N-acetylmuramate dehydrogenase [Paeniglutamicibacter terrestris]